MVQVATVERFLCVTSRKTLLFLYRNTIAFLVHPLISPGCGLQYEAGDDP
jgi:hypothetical protein